MHTFFLVLAILGAVFGHMVLCLALVNRAHATGIPISLGKLMYAALFVVVPGVPILFGCWFWVRAEHAGSAISFSTLPLAAIPYLATCWLAAIAITLQWFCRNVFEPPPVSLRSERRRVFHLLQAPTKSEPDDHDRHFLIRVPGNQTLNLDVLERGVDLRGLPQVLDGFTVLHLSDLHFTGKVPRGYFEEVVQICNDLKPDLAVMTGDLLDSRACIDWIPTTFGHLRSQYGCYFILGNHDVVVGPHVLRSALTEAGLVDLGGRWVEVSIADESIILAGNELPWLPPAADLDQAPPPASDGGPLRIALAHTPDQLPWAQRSEVDLLLAGHLHGGQIRLPVIGPIVSPSWHGVRYASGLFHSPPTLMHVSRGVSGEIPLRLNCPPEVTKLTLHAASPQDRVLAPTV